MTRLARTLLLILLASTPVFAQSKATAPAKPHLNWQPWSNQVFSDAKRENRFVLLDLEAVWCHWCHVMDANTYSDPAVIKLLQSRYIVVKADQDSRPDLSTRYEDFGWPATIVFNSDGQEIVKRQGYLAPDEMSSMLQAIIDDPSPGPSVEAAPTLTIPANAILAAPVRAKLNTNYFAGYDSKFGSWGTNQKFLDWDSVEYAMLLARRDQNKQAEHMAHQTLDEQLHLLDPAWGGVYQYSTDGDWNSPHFEKIMQMQAENLRIYSLAYAQFQHPKYLHAAQEIRRFLKTFLMSPQGAFYTSQDADIVEGHHSADYFALDDAHRRAQGIPRVDKHIYARENGWAINALTALYAATGDATVLDDALRATKWIDANRTLPGGGFRHGATDANGPYLGDNIAMERAFLALYGATADRQWLARAEATMKFIDTNFQDHDGAGFDSSKTPTDRASTPHPQRDENIDVVRSANFLFHITANATYKQIADRAMRYVAADPIVFRLPAAGPLLADFEISNEPLHLTIVGSKTDPAARALFLQALAYPSSYKRLEWWDPTQGPAGRLPNPDVQYPSLKVSAAFICTSRTCSPPIFKPADLPTKIDRLLAASAGSNNTGD
ncbi:MAG TPA: DUF255 domain-containing protein [Candidatus Acidoferrales bacterium]